MAYTGASTPSVGTTSSGTLSRDIYLDTLQHFTRNLVFVPYLYTQTIEGGTGGQFIIEGKEDAADGNLAAYTAGTQVTVTAGSQDQRIINLDRPQYEARRIDRFDEAVAKYDVISMQIRQMSANLAAKVDRKAAAAIEASSLATGLAGNGNGTVVVNTKLPGGVAAVVGAQLLGDQIAESIFAAVAAIRGSDDMGDVYVTLNPTNYSYLVQSTRATYAEYTDGVNGGYNTGKVMQVGGATVLQTNQNPATAGLIALAFTSQAAGIVKLWDIQTKITEQADFLDAKLVTASYANGMGTLRSNSAVSIKNV
jgi:hypothetical protein